MNGLVKLLLILVIIAVTLGGLNLWFNTYWLGSLYATAGPMIAFLGAVAPIVGVIGAIYLIIKIVKA